MKEWGMSTSLGIGVLGGVVILTGVAGLFVYISNVSIARVFAPAAILSASPGR